MSSRLEQLCEQLGMRMTDQRRVIARVLSASHDHPDVEELHRRSVAVDPRISIATVYRTVRMFEENGILSRLDLGDGRAPSVFVTRPLSGVLLLLAAAILVIVFMPAIAKKREQVFQED